LSDTDDNPTIMKLEMIPITTITTNISIKVKDLFIDC